MPDQRTENLAKILVNYSTKVKPDDWVIIRTHLAALPLAKEVVRHVLRAGGNPSIAIKDEDISQIILTESSDRQLDWVSQFETLTYCEADVLIALEAATNTRSLTNVDPQKQKKYKFARRELNETYRNRTAEGKYRWTLTQFPCYALAQDADMSLSEHEDFVYAATFADQIDPVGAWQKMHAEQQRIIEWLRDKDQVIVRGPNCDLALSIKGRKFVNSAGEKNMPDGEIFTGPVEDSANGWVHFTYPAISDGREVEGVELEFQDGKVVNAKASKNEAYLYTLLDSDPGARYLGEFAIGTNYGIKRFTKSILFDEKIGGTFHLAVGAGYPETGSVNKSSLHWDFICDLREDSEILVDGVVIYKDGNFSL